MPYFAGHGPHAADRSPEHSWQRGARINCRGDMTAEGGHDGFTPRRGGVCRGRLAVWRRLEWQSDVEQRLAVSRPAVAGAAAVGLDEAAQQIERCVCTRRPLVLGGP